MKQKKNLFVTLFVLMFFAFMFKGASIAGDKAEPTAQNPIKLLIQNTDSVTSPSFDWLVTFGKRIEEMSGGRVKFDIVPGGAVVPVYEMLEATHEGVIDGCLAYPHFWSGKHPAGLLFGAPPAGLGLGLDQVSAFAWMTQGEGAELYEEYYQKQLGMNVKPFVAGANGPECLGWFKKPIESLEDFRKLKFRAPPGVPSEIYQRIGIPTVTIPGTELVPAAQRGVIDAGEFVNPAFDISIGLQNIYKHYYLGGLHQIISISDILINLDKWNSFPKDIQAMFKHSAMATIGYSILTNSAVNGKALKTMVVEDGVITHETPPDIIEAYMRETQVVLKEYAEKNDFFAKVLESQQEFAQLTGPWRVYVNGSYAGIGKTALEKGLIGYNK